MHSNLSIGVDRYFYNTTPQIDQITYTDLNNKYINYWRGQYDKDLIDSVVSSYPNLYIQNNVDISIQKTLELENTIENNIMVIDNDLPTLFMQCNNNYLHFLYENLGRILYLKMLGINYNFVIAAPFDTLEDAKQDIKFLNSPFDILKIDLQKSFLPMHYYQNIKINKVVDTNPNILIHLENYSFVSKLLRQTFRKDGVAKNNIYISRKNAKSHDPRFIKNEELIENYYKELGYSIVYNENLTFSEQIDLYSNAKNIVGISGTGLINILFAPDDCKLTELRTSNYRDDDVFNYVCKFLDNRYELIDCGQSNGDANFVLRSLQYDK